jgi:hypothetical protein
MSWHTTIIPALGKLRHEGHEFKIRSGRDQEVREATDPGSLSSHKSGRKLQIHGCKDQIMSFFFSQVRCSQYIGGTLYPMTDVQISFLNHITAQ